jgi:hypothetical protein
MVFKDRPVPCRQKLIVQKNYAKFMQDDYAKFMQDDYAKFMQDDYAKFIQDDDFAKCMHEVFLEGARSLKCTTNVSTQDNSVHTCSSLDPSSEIT